MINIFYIILGEKKQIYFIKFVCVEVITSEMLWSIKKLNMIFEVFIYNDRISVGCTEPIFLYLLVPLTIRQAMCLYRHFLYKRKENSTSWRRRMFKTIQRLFNTIDVPFGGPSLQHHQPVLCLSTAGYRPLLVNVTRHDRLPYAFTYYQPRYKILLFAI